MNLRLPPPVVVCLASLLVLGGCEQSAETLPTVSSTDESAMHITGAGSSFAAALHHGITAEDLSDLDLSYTLPLSSRWDPVQMAAQGWVKAWRGYLRSNGGGA